MRRRFRSGISASSGLGLSSFSRDELDSIHYATLQILQDTGIKVMSEKACEVYRDGGALVEPKGNFWVVKLPSYLVEECAYWSPYTFVYNARNPVDNFIVEPNLFQSKTSRMVSAIRLITIGFITKALMPIAFALHSSICSLKPILSLILI